ncbi:YdiU family protein [Wenzhouxiangella sp. AB-CW3]|nr:YdiU family protein [Wenzhouxiangella sp. AB-CW3]
MPGEARFDNRYARLPPPFHSPAQPTPVAQPALIALNRPLAYRLGLDPDALATPEGTDMLAGNRPMPGTEPVAMAYAGHQFGHWVPRLGDGRALLLGEIIDSTGRRRDLHLKGSGPTPYSRGGDGRSSIGPVIREYLASEAMHALGVPTTRALAAISSGESVIRQSPEPGGLLLRVAGSHVRIGSFEYIASHDNPELVRRLADHVISVCDADLAGQPDRYLHWLSRVIDRTARMVAQWMHLGFIHGVMNTDNMSILGETIDYGPFGWMDHYDPNTVYSSIDRRGRYAYRNQPTIAQWNLARLAECLLPLIDPDTTKAVELASEQLEQFTACFESRYHTGLCKKIGLDSQHEGNLELAFDLLTRMSEQRADMTLTFRRLADLGSRDASSDGPVRSLFDDPASFDAWVGDWRQRLRGEGRDEATRQADMHRVNPAIVLRNHLAQEAVDAAVDHLDFKPMQQLMDALSRPHDPRPEDQRYMQPPQPHERVLDTFCGT